jgi:hypothetical protein
MEITNPDTLLVRAGFVLFMLALLTGFLIPMLLTPLAGAGYGAAPWKEAVAQGLQVSLALAILAGAVLVVYALR